MNKDFINFNDKVFEKIKMLVYATIEKLEYGRIKLELTIHEKKITKLTVYGKKVIK